MPVVVACPKCRGKLELEPSDSDQRMQCPVCAAVFVVKKKPTVLNAGPVHDTTAVSSQPPAVPKAKPLDNLAIEKDDSCPSRKHRDEEDDDRPRKKRRDDDEEFDDDDRPRKKRRNDDDEFDDDDRPRKKRRDEDEDFDDDDRPRKKRRDDDDEFDDDRPRKKHRDDDDDLPRKQRRDDDEDDDERLRKRHGDDDDRPRKKRRDDDEDDDDRPSRSRKKTKQKSNALLIGLIAAGAGLVVVIAIVVILILVLAASPEEAVIKDGLAAMNDMASVLETVKDKASAKDAAPKIEQIGIRLKEVKKRADALPKPSPEEKERLKSKFEAEMKTTTQRMMSAALQAGVASQGEPTFMKALQSFGKLQ